MYILMVFSGLSLVALTWAVLFGKISPSGASLSAVVLFTLMTSVFYSAHREFIKFRTQMELVRTAGLETAKKIGQEFDWDKKSE